MVLLITFRLDFRERTIPENLVMRTITFLQLNFSYQTLETIIPLYWLEIFWVFYFWTKFDLFSSVITPHLIGPVCKLTFNFSILLPCLCVSWNKWTRNHLVLHNVINFLESHMQRLYMRETLFWCQDLDAEHLKWPTEPVWATKMILNICKNKYKETC